MSGAAAEAHASEWTVDLAGMWLIRPDPEDAGVPGHWERFFSWWDNHGAMEIPGAWQKALGVDYAGVAWLARAARAPEEWVSKAGSGQRLWLRFHSVATDATVWVNGIEVGRHVGDFVPFEFDITEAVEAGWKKQAPMNPFGPGELNICVRVDGMYAGRPPAGELTERGHITKGFHDVLSVQHGGIWGGVSLRRTGRRWITPDGVRVIIRDVTSGAFALRVETAGRGGAEVHYSILAPDGTRGGAEELEATDGTPVAEASDERLWSPPRPWSPDSPSLYTLVTRLVDPGSGDMLDEERVRFGFRTVTTGGPGIHNILLNGQPLLIRGVLHWGHEPKAIAPAPPPEQVRAEFAMLKQMGFNCVCLCMWYPPPYYFDIADEMGMLIWQEHPLWKCPMEEELLPDYHRMLDAFFRRDRNHPSVVIVSGSCEHERIHPDLAAWWWKRAKEELPDRLVQVQTAFIGWINAEQTDLHDEHVYESSGRWVRFCEDVQATLDELPPKPFVMGETIVGATWVDVAAIRKAAEAEKGIPEPAVPSPASRGKPGPKWPRPWWLPKGFEEAAAYERKIADRWGEATLARFKGEADRLSIEQRKFQAEVLRTVPRHAGWVMNQIRDVPGGRLGFMDELDRWRFSPEQLRPWLSDRIALLRTPDHRWAFTGGQTLPCEVGISNFGQGPFEGEVEVRIGWETGSPHERDLRTAALHAAAGEIGWAKLALPLPPPPPGRSDTSLPRPMRVNVRAVAAGVYPNGWDLWSLPVLGDVPDGVVRLEGLPYSRKDQEPEFEERAYSSGWGLKARTWKVILPHPEQVAFKAPLWRFDAPMPAGMRVVITHKLTRRLVEFMEGGGHVVLLANRSTGGLGTKFVTLWGQVPLVIEAGGREGPLGTGDAAWVADLLHHDLTRRQPRAMPVEALGIADQVDPIVRLVFTHDHGVPKPMDSAWAARVGAAGGVLLATSLDHQDEGGAGRYMLHRFLEWLTADAPPRPRAELDAALVRTWAIG